MLNVTFVAEPRMLIIRMRRMLSSCLSGVQSTSAAPFICPFQRGLHIHNTASQPQAWREWSSCQLLPKYIFFCYRIQIWCAAFRLNHLLHYENKKSFIFCVHPLHWLCGTVDQYCVLLMAVFRMRLRIILYESVSWNLRSIIQGSVLMGGQLDHGWDARTCAYACSKRYDATLSRSLGAN